MVDAINGDEVTRCGVFAPEDDVFIYEFPAWEVDCPSKLTADKVSVAIAAYGGNSIRGLCKFGIFGTQLASPGSDQGSGGSGQGDSD